ncbi:MAG TPA: GreA/GreB family elongation factor [Phycisphaerae bacterium]|jgi:regulator of nucleoside diphosphate kinase|nr:transcription elongation factor GreAB [Phycisphaerae bacterium]HOB76206.1 GreA/GreB family elongation factor [Phycisphaerae bacterium]HOJ53910.1 GreA/GreB family elongation factor [Phycisphaerae bacterium]HOL27498.1 GreA/GreB family elongation factor [Phycisphaerae bacterium]HPP21694.1 GreA/GreB family elongation factor [Phycisphaerae bacterium]
MKSAPVVIPDRDFEQLNELIRFAPPGVIEKPHLQALERELDRCQIVPAHRVPRNTVVMGSRVRILDLATGETDTWTLVYPGEASFAEGKLSVVAPLGSAILGTRVGDVVRVRAPGGTRRVRIEKILSRPRAARSRSPELVR